MIRAPLAFYSVSVYQRRTVGLLAYATALKAAESLSLGTRKPGETEEALVGKQISFSPEYK